MKKTYFKPTTEIISVDYERQLCDVSQWSTDSGGSSTSIIEGNPGGGYRPNRSNAPSYSDEESNY